MKQDDTERDRLWLRAIIATLSVEDVQKVTEEFNRIRPDKQETMESQDDD